MDKGSRVNRYRVDRVSRKGGSEKKRKIISQSERSKESEDSSDDDDEGDNEAEKQKGNTSSNLLIKQYQNINVADSNVAPNEVNPLATHEAFITDHIKQSLEKNLPIDLKITHKLKFHTVKL